jgi:adenine deaminase
MLLPLFYFSLAAADIHSLSFISLPAAPDYSMTDKGLVDVRRHELIRPFSE